MSAYVNTIHSPCNRGNKKDNWSTTTRTVEAQIQTYPTFTTVFSGNSDNTKQKYPNKKITKGQTLIRQGTLTQ